MPQENPTRSLEEELLRVLHKPPARTMETTNGVNVDDDDVQNKETEDEEANRRRS